MATYSILKQVFKRSDIPSLKYTLIYFGMTMGSAAATTFLMVQAHISMIKLANIAYKIEYKSKI